MDSRDLFGQAHEPRFISGIHNYCDDWCERCPFTTRCFHYASRDTTGEIPPGANDLQNGPFGDTFWNVLLETIDMVKQMAEKQGMDLGALLNDEVAERVCSHGIAKEPLLARQSRVYAEKVDAWFSGDAWFEAKRDEWTRRYALALADDDPGAEVAELRDCVDVIRWYQFQIHVKLMRALDRHALAVDFDKDEGFPGDADGSAKVALIAMDRSIKAWDRLRALLGDAGDEILDMLVRLDRLRRRSERAFPGARAFMRPGFDTETSRSDILAT